MSSELLGDIDPDIKDGVELDDDRSSLSFEGLKGFLVLYVWLSSKLFMKGFEVLRFRVSSISIPSVHSNVTHALAEKGCNISITIILVS